MDALQKKTPTNTQIHPLATLDNSEVRQGIDVLCRIRPKFQHENYVKYSIVRNHRLEITETGPDNEVQNQRTFSFTRIYDQPTSQEEIHQKQVLPLIYEMFTKNKGGLVFSYGVTNSGKTYTIIGNNESPGLLPLTLRTLEDLRCALHAGRPTVQLGDQMLEFNQSPYAGFRLVDLHYCFQALEIYNEDIYDLLADKSSKAKLQLKELYERKYTVKDATEKNIDSTSGFLGWLHKALQNRQMGETNLNNQSSRSHTIFKVGVTFSYQNATYTMNENATLCIVDLAGSERAKKAETQGSQLTEACNINKSLLVLGKCLKQMRCITESESINRIPFRECKLTRLLSEFFTDENRILMIINVKLTREDLDETIKVLHYGALSVHVNLLKAKIYQATISVENRQAPDQPRAHQKRTQQDQIRKAKMLIQNTTSNMLFQQDIQTELLRGKIKDLEALNEQMKRTFGVEERRSRSRRSETNFELPVMESGRKLHKSLERLKSEKNLSDSLSNSVDQFSQEPVQQFEGNHQMDRMPLFVIQEGSKERQRESYELAQQQDIEQYTFGFDQGRRNEIHEEIPEIKPCSQGFGASEHIKIIDEQFELGEGVHRCVSEIREPVASSAQEERELDENAASEQDENKENRNPSSGLNASVETPKKMDQQTNTTPFDEMKQKMFSQFLTMDHEKHQKDRENFKQNLIRNLVTELDDQENNPSVANIINASEKKQQQLAEKFTSNSKLKVVMEEVEEHDSDRDKKPLQKKATKAQKNQKKQRKRKR